ncbi:pyridoxal phosphate-dependent aminotransferase [Methanomethylophilus alvi]|jgi:aspartate aminotransferase|nr:aminotransferase class I/II-fold pyridoxal phosphate-dependent enzyme [Methanomethylophilus alvi]MCI5973251.1 aminotransferase class I/II-fold pyridoxal phosphate-dependent enzyme [Methanomethylophilus alvi]MDD7480465.1 aminotransferase class I/II-fold pyridoxal phosphate-dependent enzyme [Methanomethylophilus alvi]MDY7060527.1 aminotransferase class I/II-fold pyridoxal phosphate-dependent enzyme [Methanomethylophilus alvi]CDF31362.1 aminotransferase classes I and II superfamily [Methanocull
MTNGMKVSDRLAAIPMSGIRKMFDLAKPDSINLGLGEPDLEPPKEAIEGMNAAAVDGKNKYSPTAGIPELRDAIAERFSRYNPGLSGRNVIVTPSGSTALLEMTQAFVDPGDEVLVPSPGFVIYAPHASLAGGKPVEYRLTEGDFQPDIDYIQDRITEKTKMIVVNNPSNPTGGVLSEESRKALADIAHDKDVMIMSDEVYESFVYEGRHQSFLPYLDRAVVVGGFSKMMAVTGWRLGFAIANEECMDALVKMQYHVCASPGMPAMYGVLNAMPSIDPYLENARATFKKRRDLISKRINEIDGMSIIPPKGAFYAFPSFDLDMTSQELANELVKAGLICTPGSAFGTFGEGHLRFSYAASEEKIDKGMDILADTVRKIKGGRI